MLWRSQKTHIENSEPISIEAKTGDYWTMQDMTPEICALVDDDEETQLVDVRDGKKYWILKARNGDCWMTQNLDYDLANTSLQVLDPETSNVSIERIVIPTGWVQKINYVNFSEGGEYYLGGGSSNNGNYVYPDCTENGVENCHYHRGNYYSWYAATATEKKASTAEAVQTNESICPKGWRLPHAENWTSKYSYGSLTNAYGATNSATGNNGRLVRAAPLYFTHAGYVRNGSHTSGSVYQGDGEGFYWAAEAYTNTYATEFWFNNSTVAPVASWNSYWGYSVRCVAI